MRQSDIISRFQARGSLCKTLLLKRLITVFLKANACLLRKASKRKMKTQRDPSAALAPQTTTSTVAMATLARGVRALLPDLFLLLAHKQVQK